jgi:D-amino peptidase
MKIYISADMEGTAGVSSWDQVDARNYTADYFIYQKIMTAEVCAAIAGAGKAGADEFLINDSHGPMRNLLLDELPKDSHVIFGNRKPYSMVEGLDRSFDGIFFTGYHGAIGERNATLCHTYTPSVVYDARLNGMRCSEATLNAALAGHYGVPVLLITGDHTTIETAREQLPWLTGVIVKESIGNYAVDSLSPQAAQDAIREGAARSVRKIKDARPFVVEPPIVLEIDLAKVEHADWIELIPGFERSGDRAVRFTSDDYPTVFKAFVAAFRMGAVADQRS